MSTVTLTKNPLVVERRGIKVRQQKAGESDRAYAQAAARYAGRIFRELSESDDYRFSHESFTVRDALLIAEARFCDLGTFGVEHIAQGRGWNSPAIDYLNSGDSYGLTVLYVRGQFRVGDWGYYVERGQYE